MVKLIWITPEAEKIISYCARVSSPKNQENYDTMDKLLKYCIDNKHWSVFEMANMCLEITTSRAISAQILRHRSFCAQEYSLRYSEAQSFEYYDARSQDSKNRQNSIDNLPENVQDWFIDAQSQVTILSNDLYEQALKYNIAKECARFLLPMSTRTKLYFNGSIRSWITYFQVRLDKSTQLEHREIAEQCKNIFKEQLPIISKALNF